MQIFLLTALTMVAFAANSLLNRFALEGGAIDAASFAAIRLASGAAVLALLAQARGAREPLFVRRRIAGVAGLTAYMLGFSFAYLSLGAAPGALILFGGVQLTMFAGARMRGEPMGAWRIAGAVLAFAGLVWLLWPSGPAAIPLEGAFLMTLAALGWGVYSLAGRTSSNPLGETAANFALALPFSLAALALAPLHLTKAGIALAAISGAVTSGLGYALWYSVLPRLQTTTAAVAQLSVPVIAAVGALALLQEPLTLRVAGAGLLVLGGIAVALKR